MPKLMQHGTRSLLEPPFAGAPQRLASAGQMCRSPEALKGHSRNSMDPHPAHACRSLPSTMRRQDVRSWMCWTPLSRRCTSQSQRDIQVTHGPEEDRADALQCSTLAWHGTRVKGVGLPALGFCLGFFGWDRWCLD